MTAGEIAMARALGRCRFLSASYDKRWGRAISVRAGAPEPRISEKEAHELRRLVQRYRRQIAAGVVRLAFDPVPPVPPPAPPAPADQLPLSI